MEKIPRKIHLILKNKNSLQDSHQSFYKQLQALHPGWEIQVYDDGDAQRIVQEEYPQWLEQYLLFPRNIQRVDIFRLIALHRHGGFYMDTDMHLYRSLDGLLEHTLVLAEEKTLSPLECNRLNHQYALRIANYMLGAIAGHPFLEEIIATAIANCYAPIRSEHDILETTGPGMLTRLYHQHQSHYPDILLLKNEKHYCLKKCCATPSCHFGDYAAHLHQGSWRWQ
jgi:mannosyltransferase OCH1-like enzyme